MAVIRGFLPEVKGRGAKHHTQVDCLYFDFMDVDDRILQLSTLGSEHRQSKPKVSQTIQIGTEAARELQAILGRAFGAVADVSSDLPDDSRPTFNDGPSGAREPTDPIDRFTRRAGLRGVEDLEVAGSRARRLVLANDDRPMLGGTWHLADFTNFARLTYRDVEQELRSAPANYKRMALIVRDLSAELTDILASMHIDVVDVHDLDLSPAPLSGAVGSSLSATESPAPENGESGDVLPRHLTAAPQHAEDAPDTTSFAWVEDLLNSQAYATQKASAGRACVSDDVARSVLVAVSHLGHSGPIEDVEHKAGLAPGTLRRIMPQLRRVLNIEGYEAIAVADHVMTIDQELLLQQFGLTDLQRLEGGRS